MMIEFKTTNNNFSIIDMFLMEQEFHTIPPFTNITIKTEDTTYWYKVVRQENGYWYIITN